MMLISYYAVVQAEAVANGAVMGFGKSGAGDHGGERVFGEMRWGRRKSNAVGDGGIILLWRIWQGAWRGSARPRAWVP